MRAGHPARLYAFDNSRAIAIVLIVAGHGYGPWVIDTFAEKFIASFITGGTALFVLISGFFFHHSFYKTFAWWTFLRAKLINVGVPYLVLTGVYCVVVGWLSPERVPVSGALPWSAGGITDFVRLFGQYAYTGNALPAYWYVPFILLVFAASPLFIRFIELKLPVQLAVLGASLLMSAIVHRPLDNNNPFHSVLYFSSVYLLGILTSAYRTHVFAFLQRYAPGIAVLLAVVAGLKVLVDGHHGNLHKADIFAFKGIDIFLVQKCLQAGLMLSLLMRFADRRIPILEYVAERSFAIFFIHNWVAVLLLKAVPWMGTSGLPGFYVALIIASASLVASIAVANALRALLKDRSRLLIGY
jgi:peptidoglycan/LPS O-acetylase OafA/YrhL